MAMRSNNSSVLPSHTGPQFKDKPLLSGLGSSGGGISLGNSPTGGAGGSSGPIVGRITLRRVILFTGSCLFVYIVLSTMFGINKPDASGFPKVKHQEHDPYEDLPNNPVIPDDNNRYGRPPPPAPGGGVQYGQEYPIQPPHPAAPGQPAPPIQLDASEGEGNAENASGETEQQALVDDEGNVIEQGEIAETPLAIATRARKASPVTYAQMLSATRRERDYAVALMVREAELALASTEVYSVTNKKQVAPSGDIHDYLSLSKYFWPNKDKPDGLPYKRIDGHINPEIETVRDYRLLRTMIREVHMMGMAFHFTGRKEFADKSAMRLKEWFLDEATYMNPNINYGSLRKGEKLGARTGVLDMFTIFRVFDALHYLKQEPTWPQDLIPRLQEWFTRYVYWLETSTLAKVERKGNNNHGTYFDVQIIGIYLFLGRVEDAREVAQQALHTRLDPQITAKGEQPEEMERKTSWYYSVFNLQALMTLARWGDDLGVDMWFYEGPKGQSIKKAIDFMLPYALSGGEGWPVENLKGYDMTDYLKCLQIGWHIYGDEKYLEAIEVLEPKVRKDMEEGKIKTVSTFMCDMSTLMEATTRGGQGFIWHWCLT
ncbi:MAG: alginate lyase-domain-containing protein [Linnemannia gamsii]|nr:MAG: alginate lyase-domain-containing protein [Linnemannia gamsii]